MRYLRTIFNQEIAAGTVKQESYPFGRNKYRPPATRRVKKALKLEDVEKINDYTPAILRELSRPHVTRMVVWEVYRRGCPEGYGYTPFCEHLSSSPHNCPSTSGTPPSPNPPSQMPS